MRTTKIGLLVLGMFLLLGGGVFANGQQSPGAGEETTIVMWAHITPGLAQWNDIALPRYMEEHPNVKIDYSEHQYKTYTTQIITAVSGGGGPDIFDNNAVTKGAFEPKGMLAPLNLSAMGYSEFDDLYDEFLPGSLEPWRSKDGDLLGVPFDTSIWQLVLNKKLFSEIGLDADKDAPKSWDEFFSVSEKIHSGTGKKGYQLPFGAGFGWYLIIWEPMHWQYGGRVFDDNQMSALDSDATRKSFKLWYDIRNTYDTGCVSDYPGDNPVYEFAQGGSAMSFAGPFVSGQITSVNSPDVVGNYTVQEWPQVDPNNKVAVLNSWGWMINRNSENVDAASLFIQWYYRQSVEGYLNGGGACPRIDVYDNPKVQAETGYEVFKAGMAYARPREGTPYYNETGDAIMKALDDVVLLKKDMEPVIKEMHETVNKIQKGE
jgi:ABC-type glycerol-3-phosphate transport system substrate-binding protein